MLLSYPQLRKPINGNIILAGDIGGTKANLSLFSIEGESDFHVIREDKLNSGAFDNIADLLREFNPENLQPHAVCFGVAGPVLDDRAKLSNLHWGIDKKELSALFPAARIHLINDLKATAYGLAMLKEQDIAVIHSVKPEIGGNAAIIAPGTGLGEAGIFWDGKLFHPFSSEGGHSDFAARNSGDFELYTFLSEQFGHVSWERVISGPGITNIYRFLKEIKKMEEPEWLTQKLVHGDKAAVISSHTLQSEICAETMRLFVRFLAFESANLALKFNATGGLFIGGGIPPKILQLLENNQFVHSFLQSGRLNILLEKVPVKIILNPKTALLGAAYYAATH